MNIEETFHKRILVCVDQKQFTNIHNFDHIHIKTTKIMVGKVFHKHKRWKI